MNHTVSPIHQSFGAQEVAPFLLGQDYAMDDVDQLLPNIGMGFSRGTLENMLKHTSMDTFAMDTIQNPVTQSSLSTPIQFLQAWLPGQVEVLTAAQEIDNFIGFTVAGSWEDEQIVQEVLEMTGAPVPYGDLTVIPYTDWNVNYVTRNVVRFELGMRVGPLEEARAAKARIDSGGTKRKSCGIQLEIQRNQLGFFGYNAGNNLTYGFLNDPSLLPYNTVATGAVSNSKLWSLKTYQEIVADLLTAFQTIRTQSKGRIKPNKTKMTLAVATNCVDYLARTTDFGVSVIAWLREFYPQVRVEDAPQLNGANGGANVFYVWADTVDDASTDDKKTFIQIIPAKFQLLGVDKHSKGYEEDYSNASAGVMCKRPYAVYRGSGI